MITCFSYTFTPALIAQLFIAAILSACFLQSAVDKVVDYKGNLSWLMDHFKNTFLKNMVPVLLLTITLMELVGGFLCAAGIIDYIINQTTELILIGLIINSLTLLFLFLGQRIAKDYEGAAVLTNYFIIAVIGILSFSIA